METNRTEVRLRQTPTFLDVSDTSTSVVAVKANTTVTLFSPIIKPGSVDPPIVIWFVKGRSVQMPFNDNTSRAEISLDPSWQQTHIACVVENEFGRAAHFFILNFHTQPRFLLALNDRIEVESGDDIQLILHVTANPSPTFEWLHDEEIIDEKRTETTVVNSVIVHSLFIRTVQRKDLGNYTVVVENTEGRISNSTRLVLKSCK